MKFNFNIDSFIQNHVTFRKESILKQDFEQNYNLLSNRINNKSVLVIGGAGTIGSSYIKAIVKFDIKKLVVIDINENRLTKLIQDIDSLKGQFAPFEFITYPVNFGDRVFEKLFRQHGPFDIVANFASHTHVRSEKDIFSIEAMIENNVLNVSKLLDLLLEFPPEHFFSVSTDKAANPASIMGASKKLMEELITAYSVKLPITTARLGNVAFSNGSILQGFIEHMNKNQPWACPVGIRRFFMSSQESGELCLMASIMGEPGDIFYPKLDNEKDMIAYELIALDLFYELGYEPDICQSEEEAKQKALALTPNSRKYPIYFFISNTSGEKTFAELFTEKEILDNNSFINLGVIKNSTKRSITEVNEILSNLEALFKKETISKAEIVEVLKVYLPNFVHIETGKGLDSKM